MLEPPAHSITTGILILLIALTFVGWLFVLWAY
jgi:hypothetical protein